MSRLVGLIVLVVIVIAILIFFGFIELSPEGEAALEGASDSVGEAVENTGQAIKDAGDSQ